MKQLSYTEQSRMFAKLNDLPGGAIETQTDEERQLILKGAKYLTQEEEKMVKLLAAPPSHIKKFKAC